MVEGMLKSFNDEGQRCASIDGDEQYKFFRQHIMAPAARAMEKTRDLHSPSIDSDEDDDYTDEYIAAARAHQQRQRASTGPSSPPARMDRTAPGQ